MQKTYAFIYRSIRTSSSATPTPGRSSGSQHELKAQIGSEAFKQMRGTISFPFEPGEHQRITVKVMDFRGNEVVRVMPVEGGQYR